MLLKLKEQSLLKYKTEHSAIFLKNQFSEKSKATWVDVLPENLKPINVRFLFQLKYNKEDTNRNINIIRWRGSL